MSTLRILRCIVAIALCHTVAAQEAPDTILVNGKIVTVDDYFSISEAVAIRGDRILAVGSDEEIRALAGSDSEVMDLDGRTVLPGLIDNHNHVIRATEYWPNEARLDGVTNRYEALARLADKSGQLPAGDWLMTLGGWSEGQFSGDRSEFSLENLDGVAPDRPAFIQSGYEHALVNTAWFEEMRIPLISTAEPEGFEAYVERDASGRVTGKVNGGFPMIEQAIERFPVVPAEQQASAIRASFSYLNSLGLTAVYDPAGVGISRESYQRLRTMADSSGLSVRIAHTLGGSTPRTEDDVRALIAEIRSTRPFQGDVMLDLVAIGEIYYTPFHWDSSTRATDPSDYDVGLAKEILIASAEGGWSVQTHATRPETIDHLLDLIEEVNEEQPIRGLRWSITHADAITAEQLERVRHLGMNLQLRSFAAMYDRTPVVEALGDSAYHMPPLRLVQDSGVAYGLGSDGTKAAQINPFVTLWWAVTGKAVNGSTILRQTLTREEALIASTRSNAYLMYQEQNIGSIRAGFLADMVVLDRDYLTVPEDEIKAIRPVATIVGGRVVYGSL
ncbi:MAG: amidohydrolase [Candidatus Rariloculaceae bacterium]